jgi:hypothetical protein
MKNKMILGICVFATLLVSMLALSTNSYVLAAEVNCCEADCGHELFIEHEYDYELEQAFREFIFARFNVESDEELEYLIVSGQIDRGMILEYRKDFFPPTRQGRFSGPGVQCCPAMSVGFRGPMSLPRRDGNGRLVGWVEVCFNCRTVFSITDAHWRSISHQVYLPIGWWYESSL